MDTATSVHHSRFLSSVAHAGTGGDTRKFVKRPPVKDGLFRPHNETEAVGFEPTSVSVSDLFQYVCFACQGAPSSPERACATDVSNNFPLLVSALARLLPLLVTRHLSLVTVLCAPRKSEKRQHLRCSAIELRERKAQSSRWDSNPQPTPQKGCV